jgi:ABC-2 type transport system ATP-binding protein
LILRERIEGSAWQALPGLKAFRKISDFEWELEGEDPESLKKQLLSLSLQNNWNLVSLQSESRSLEDIFRGLTQSLNHE